MSCNSNQKPMYLVSFKIGETKTFKLIPFSNESKFVECVYDPTDKVLHVASNDKYKTFNVIPVLNDKGERIRVGYRENEKGEKVDVYKQERVEVETFYEFNIIEPSEILDFVKAITHNYNEAYVVSILYPNQKQETKKSTKKVAEVKKD